MRTRYRGVNNFNNFGNVLVFRLYVRVLSYVYDSLEIKPLRILCVLLMKLVKFSI